MDVTLGPSTRVGAEISAGTGVAVAVVVSAVSAYLSGVPPDVRRQVRMGDVDAAVYDLRGRRGRRSSRSSRAGRRLDDDVSEPAAHEVPRGGEPDRVDVALIAPCEVIVVRAPGRFEACVK